MSHRSTSGMDWIRLSTRLAIYHRDGFDCTYCAGAFEFDDLGQLGYGLSLDHLTGPSNAPSNLVTACKPCNDWRNSKSLESWLTHLEANGYDPVAIRARIATNVARPLDMAEGKRLALLRRPKYVNGHRRKAA